jgi:AraC-like DNA-binding protein
MKKQQTFQTRQHMIKGEYEIYHYKDSKLVNVNIHHHDFFECYYFMSGAVRFQIEGKNYSLKPGDIVLINTSDLHQAKILDMSIQYERVVLWLNRDFVQRLSTPMTNLADCFNKLDRKNIIRAEIETQQHIRSLMDQLINLENYQGFGADIFARACTAELLVLMNIEMLNLSKLPKVEVRKNQVIEEMIDYINNHLEEPLQIDTLADQFFLSKFHLSRKFSKQTGTTLHHFITQKRLILAKDLILQHLPITNVYRQCGFGDYSNFFRAFRSEYNMTPKQYYEQMLKLTTEDN